MSAIIADEDDPLTVIARMVVNPDLDIAVRLSAANTCLPFLYPRLSASQVDARINVTKVDSSDLLRRIDERLSRIAPAERAVSIEHKTDVVDTIVDVPVVDDEMAA